MAGLQAGDEAHQGFWAGGIQGASQGSQYGPWGALIGGIVGHGVGYFQGTKARDARKEFEQLDRNLNPYDPQIQANIMRLRQMQRNLQAGTDPSSAFARQQQSNALAQTQQNIMRSGGGVSQLLRAQQAANVGNAQIGASAAARSQQLIPLEMEMTAMLSNRAWQLAVNRRAEALARKEQKQQDINNAMAGGMANSPGGGMGGGMNMFKRGAPADRSLNNQAQPMQTMMPQSAPLSYQPLV